MLHARRGGNDCGDACLAGHAPLPCAHNTRNKTQARELEQSALDLQDNPVSGGFGRKVCVTVCDCVFPAVGRPVSLIVVLTPLD